MKKLIIGSAAFLIVLLVPFLFLVNILFAPLGWINDWISKDPTFAASVVQVHFETEEGAKEMMQLYQPTVAGFESEWAGYGVEVPMNYIATVFVMSETEPDASKIDELLNDALFWFEEVVHGCGDTEDEECVPWIEIIPHRHSLDEYISNMKRIAPFDEKFRDIDDDLIKEMIAGVPENFDYSSVNGGIGNGGMIEGMPENLEELREEYDFIYPLDSGYVITADYNEWYNAAGSYRFHDAIDLANGREGGRIYSSTDGEVVYSTYVGQPLGGGKRSDVNAVIVAYRSVRIWYWHMKDPPLYEVGERVSAGDILGYVGNTGVSTGPHLHYQVQLDGVTVNPRIFVDFENRQGY